MSDATSLLHLYETTVYSGIPGLALTKGQLFVRGECPIMSAATSSGDGIILGDGVSANNNVALTILEESGLNVRSGFVVYQNV